MGSELDPPGGNEPEGDKTKPAEKPEGEQRPAYAWSDDSTEPEEGTPSQYPSGGSMEFQDAATTKPRPPSPAELRAREKFAKKQEELEEARLAAEAKRKHQKRVLIGSAAAVGVVGLVAGLGYWAFSGPNVTAQCAREDVNGQPIIVPDSYCTGHTSGLNGFFFYGGHQYRYYYGSSGSVGQRPIGGSTTAPRGATIRTKSGTTLQRGGLGGKLSGGSGS